MNFSVGCNLKAYRRFVCSFDLILSCNFLECCNLHALQFPYLNPFFPYQSLKLITITFVEKNEKSAEGPNNKNDNKEKKLTI